ncbi:hypothetical protein PI124_g17492 [Phytophthora idaei]|nr:hypothetical protein PI125_g18070 [Phytophthora idaei]KAG3237525.1 hypothetical protein PI124_g17492 [Phytophthora idaei]
MCLLVAFNVNGGLLIPLRLTRIASTGATKLNYHGLSPTISLMFSLEEPSTHINLSNNAFV